MNAKNLTVFPFWQWKKAIASIIAVYASLSAVDLHQLR